MIFQNATVSQCVVRIDNPSTSYRLLGDRPVLAWILREFIRFGATNFLLLTDAAPPDVLNFLPRRVRVAVSVPPAGSGSGGALLHASSQLDDRFLLCDGSTLFDWNVANLLADAAADEAEVIARVVLSDAGMSSGIALLHKGLVDYLRPVCSLETDVLPELATRGLLRVTPMNGSSEAEDDVFGRAPSSSVWACDAGTGPGNVRPADPLTGSTVRSSRDLRIHAGDDAAQEAPVARAADERDRTSSQRASEPTASRAANYLRRALFLDRDGVLNIDHGYVGSRDRFEWVDGALDAIRYATEAGWHVFVVTNQSGVARGLYTEEAVRDLLDWMGDQARAAGGTIDDARFCPFHPEAELEAYRRNHSWRKPLPGMLLDLIRAWVVDPAQAVMVGDQETDMRAAAAANVAGYFFRGGNLLAFLRPILTQGTQPHVGLA